MKFLAIDTSAKYLSVVAHRDGRTERLFLPDCALRHSVLLMDAVKQTLSRAELLPAECDFFAAVVGPGSFTGIRIGISTVKGLCFACDRPALGVTSFDCIAYDDRNGRKLALVDAGRGRFYACAYDGTEVVVPPAFLSEEEVSALIAEGFSPAGTEQIFPGIRLADPGTGLLNAVLGKADGRACAADALHAVYLRRSSAEENRK